MHYIGYWIIFVVGVVKQAGFGISFFIFVNWSDTFCHLEYKYSIYGVELANTRSRQAGTIFSIKISDISTNIHSFCYAVAHTTERVHHDRFYST